MTLYKQLVVGMITVFVLLMASVFVIEFNTTRNSLEQQQRSEMNNTINTVGLALAPYLKDKDKVAVESVINALFDGSFVLSSSIDFPRFRGRDHSYLSDTTELRAHLV